MSQSLLPLSGCIVRQNVWLKVHWHSSSRSTYWLEKSGSLQAFSQDLKNGCPKCAIGRAQMSNLQGNIYEKKNDFSVISGHPQDAWMPI